MTTSPTGWERERRVHFDEIVADYDRVRPDYPPDLFADALNYAGGPIEGKRALEIGAGTGKATKPFLDAGYAVTAVELGANMGDFLRERYRGHKDFSVIVSPFEDAVLGEDTFDLIYAASAFHWVDAQIGCPKAFRLLRTGGAITLFRYNFNYIPPEGEKLSEEIHAAYQKHLYSFYTWRERSDIKKMTKKGFEKNPKIQSGFGFDDLSAYGFTDVTMNLYEATRIYGADEWIAMLDTLSNHRNLPESNRAALYAEVKAAIEKNGGRYNVDYVFQLYMGRKP